MFRLFVVVAMLGLVAHAWALDGDWSATTDDVKRWYQSLTAPDTGALCCGEADAYWADSFEVQGNQYVAILTDDRNIRGRQTRDNGARFVVPNTKLKIDAGNPTGHGVIFLRPGTDDVLCYIAPGGG